MLRGHSVPGKKPNLLFILRTFNKKQIFIFFLNDKNYIILKPFHSAWADYCDTCFKILQSYQTWNSVLWKLLCKAKKEDWGHLARPNSKHFVLLMAVFLHRGIQSSAKLNHSVAFPYPVWTSPGDPDWLPKSSQGERGGAGAPCHSDRCSCGGSCFHGWVIILHRLERARPGLTKMKCHCQQAMAQLWNPHPGKADTLGNTYSTAHHVLNLERPYNTFLYLASKCLLKLWFHPLHI